MKKIEFKKGGKITIQQIALAGMMLALITLFKIGDKFMPKTPIGASWVELYMIFGTIMVLILPFMISTLVLIAAPFLWFITGNTWQANPLSFLLDYSLPILSLLVIYGARFLPKKQISFGKITISWTGVGIILLTIVAFTIKWFWHTVSGVISYNVVWEASATLNAPYVFATMGGCLVVTLIMLPKISTIQHLVNQQGMRW